jgi:hypothetical protein
MLGVYCLNFSKEFFMEMSTKDIITQVIGFVAMILIVISFQQKTRKKILTLQLISMSLWTVHFLMLGAYTGMALNLVSAVRSYFYAVRETKKWANHDAIPVIFFLLSVVFSVVTWAGPASLLPMAAVCISTVVLWSKNPRVIRVCSYPASISWLTFNILSGSYAGTMTEIFIQVSIIVGIIRFDIKKKDKRAIPEV